MGTGASSGGSQAGSNPNVKEGSIPSTDDKSSRKASSISKKHSNGFITLSYEPTNTPLIRKRGFIKEGFPVHGLIQDKYFLIKDHFEGIDKLKTLDKYGAPNFRKSCGPYPVYGMGQPSRDGLAHVIQSLVENGHKVRGILNNLNSPLCRSDVDSCRSSMMLLWVYLLFISQEKSEKTTSFRIAIVIQFQVVCCLKIKAF